MELSIKSKKKILPLENNPSDSRLKVIYGDVIQTLTTRMGTGGGNVPLVLISYEEDDMLCREEIL